MVTIYKLNGISVFKRYREELKEFEFRLFEDNELHMMRFPETHNIGRMLDSVWEYIQELTGKPLYNITTEVTVG